VRVLFDVHDWAAALATVLAAPCGCGPSHGHVAPTTITRIDARTSDAAIDATSRETSATPALPKGHLTLADRKAWRAVLGWPDDCEEAHDSTAISGIAAMDFHLMEDGTYVVEVTCTTGAYQGYGRFYSLDERGTERRNAPITFGTVSSPDRKLVALDTQEPPGLWTWGVHDSLTIHDRFRGVGDCGTFTRFVFAWGHARRVECRAKLACDGKSFDPRLWPTCPPV
jgi:hypothetical protein